MGLRGSVIVAAVAIAACTHTVVGTGGGSSSGASSSGGTALSGTQVFKLCQLLLQDCSILTGTVGECRVAFQALRTTPSCAGMIESASCDTLASIESSCFPPCGAGTEPTCNGTDTITTCADNGDGTGGELFTFSCEAGCTAKGVSYTGTCGVTGPTGDSSPTGKAQCWCN
jgi:hypothetical protein